MKYLPILLIVGIVLISGCAKQKEPFGDRMFVETQINPIDPAWNNLQGGPREYGFIQNNEANIEFIATKYMQDTKGLMDIKINLPGQFELIGGDTEWSGNDVSKALNLRLIPKEKGRFEIEITATNIENKFSAKQKIIACVGKDIEELTTYCVQEESSLPLEQPINVP